MPEHKYYLTVDPNKRQPQNDGHIAIISLGSPQLGDTEVVVLDVDVFETIEKIHEWYKKKK